MPKQKADKPTDNRQQITKDLQDLWRRRDRLNESEWTKLYEFIYHILRTKRGGFGSWLKHVPNEDLNVEKNSEFSSKFEAYVWEYYLEKILIPVCDKKQYIDINQIISKAYFRRAFTNFLISKGRYFNNRPWINQSDEMGPHNLQGNDEDFDVFEHLNENKIDPDWRPSPGQKWILWNFGLDLATVTASARDFFNRLTQEDRNFFKELVIEEKTLKDQKEQMPNTNYYAASRLGISKNKQKFPNYYKTRIGQWLADLGLFLNLREPDSHEREMLFIVLQILCACALDGVDADRPSGTEPDDPSPDA